MFLFSGFVVFVFLLSCIKHLYQYFVVQGYHSLEEQRSAPHRDRQVVARGAEAAVALRAEWLGGAQGLGMPAELLKPPELSCV